MRLLGLIFCICVLGSSLNIVWQDRNYLNGNADHHNHGPHEHNIWYMRAVEEKDFWGEQVNPKGWVVGFWYFFVFIADMLPISLYVSLQTVRFVQTVVFGFE